MMIQSMGYDDTEQAVPRPRVTLYARILTDDIVEPVARYIQNVSSTNYNLENNHIFLNKQKCIFEENTFNVVTEYVI